MVDSHLKEHNRQPDHIVPPDGICDQRFPFLPAQSFLPAHLYEEIMMLSHKDDRTAFVIREGFDLLKEAKEGASAFRFHFYLQSLFDI